MKKTERFVEANGLKLFVEERGSADDPALLLIMGLGCQMTMWPEDLVDDLVRRGYRVIRFDNRDIGLSDAYPTARACNLPLAYLQYKLGLRSAADYSLYDMADDAVGVLDALEIDQAHVVGVSMGGMISQIMAAQYPDRVNSLTLLMTSCNEANVAAVNLAATWHLCRGRFVGTTWEAFRSVGLGYWRAIQSPKYPMPNERMEQILKQEYDRSYRPCGVERQIMAIAATGSLKRLLPKIRHTTQIIHGDSDPLLKVGGAKTLAKLIPNAKLKVISGMGHDLPDELIGDFAHLIHRNVLRSLAPEPAARETTRKSLLASLLQTATAWAQG